VTTPTPLTAPRAYGLSIALRSAGRDSAKPLRFHHADQGTTVRMKPASRK
jgi:hypothetical protein